MNERANHGTIWNCAGRARRAAAKNGWRTAAREAKSPEWFVTRVLRIDEPRASYLPAGRSVRQID